METIESLQATLEALVTTGHRNRLLARGLARGMIWQEGRLPPDSPNLGLELTQDLLDHGFRVLDAALTLRQLDADSSQLDRAFEIAGAAIESAVRRGDSTDPQYGFYLTCAAAAFHIGHYSARAYSLLGGELEALNLSTPEKTLVCLMRRDLNAMIGICRNWFNSPEISDDAIANNLVENPHFSIDDAVFISLTNNFCRALAEFEYALVTGIGALVTRAIERLQTGVDAAANHAHVPLWWVSRLASHLIDDLWNQSYHTRLPRIPPDINPQWNKLRGNLIRLLVSRDLANVDFWPSQLHAATRVVDTADDLVVALPTSSGKTRIAELCILRCLSNGQRVVYVTPLRALSAQIELTLAGVFRPLGFSTSSVYGASGVAVVDVETLKSGDIVVATPEKLDFAIRQDPEVIDDVGLIVLDEGHMIGLGEREIRYETLVQRLLRRADADRRRIVCLSAIFSPGTSFDSFNEWIRGGEPGEAIRSVWRPTRQRPATLVWGEDAARLDYTVEGENVFIQRFVESIPPTGTRRTPFPKNRGELVVAATTRFVGRGQAVLIYCPIRSSVETCAGVFIEAVQRGFAKSWLTPAHADAIEPALRVGREWLGDDHPAVCALKLGIAVHHGRLPRPFLRELETLLKERKLSIAVSSPTLAAGVDLSFEILILYSLWRRRRLIPETEFASVIGRVGRAHVDLDGIFLVPVHEKKAATTKKRVHEFHGLVARARERTMESGILLLVEYYIQVLSRKLNVPQADLAEYVLNNQEFWNNVTEGDEDRDEWLRVGTNELDNGILSTIADLDCSVAEVADRLDEALAESYWAKRTAEKGDEFYQAQRALIQSRARWIWSVTDAPRRRGCFAAGIGHAAGQIIAKHSAELGQFLVEGELAIAARDPATAAAAIVKIGEILFSVYPFRSDPPERWPEIVAGWLSGTPTSEFLNADEIAFLQNDIIYRLVWAIESVRSELGALGVLPEGAVTGHLSLCLTFGAPNVTVALLQQAGFSSRRIAVVIVEQFALDFSSGKALREWLIAVSNGAVTPGLSVEDRPEWERFVESTRRRSHGTWQRSSETLPVKWLNDPLPPGTAVRAADAPEEGNIDILDADLTKVGLIQDRSLTKGGCITAEIADPPDHVMIRRYGP